MQYKGDLFTITNACCTFQQKCYFCQQFTQFFVVIGNCENCKKVFKDSFN